MKRLIIPMLAGALIVGCAATPEQQAASAERDARTQGKLEQTLAGYTAGEPTACLPPRNTRQTRYFGNTILYEVSGRLIYRNDTNGGCNLERDDVLVTQSPLGRLCSGDIARTVDRNSNFMTGSCALGEFVPYKKDRS